MSNDEQLVEQMQKEAFVTEWLRTGDPFKAAHTVFPADPGRAMRASWEWTKDADVLEYRQALLSATDGCAGIPSRNELARELYQFIGNIEDKELRLSGYELFAKMMGYIEKPSPVTIDNRHVTVNKVLVVRDHGSDDAWERQLSENQKRLTAPVN